MKEKIKIKDDEGIEELIDFYKFFHHLKKFHESSVSLHEENEHYFTVNDNFQKTLEPINQ